jgi:hypothetical protein
MQISNKVTKIIQLASVKDFMIFYSVEGLPRGAEMERERAFVDEIKKKSVTTRSRIHEHTILLRFLGIILRVSDLRFPYTMFTVANQFQTTFAQGGWGERSKIR